jgi:dihydrofolate reductase
MSMGKVVAVFSLSLDGFIAGLAGPDDDVQRLFGWFFSGDTDFPAADGAMVLKLSSASAELFRERYESTGALVSGRRMFDVAGAWDSFIVNAPRHVWPRGRHRSSKRRKRDDLHSECRPTWRN